MNAEILDAGSGIELHPRSLDDAIEMWAVIDDNRADLRAWLPWVDATTAPVDVRRFAEFSQRSFQNSIAFEYAIRVHGALAGAVGTHEIDWTNRATSIGYWLAPGERGRGVTTRAVATLVDRCIADLRLHRFVIQCVVENERSRAVPERLGFTLEGTLAGAYFLHHRYRDIALYATTAPQFRVRPEIERLRENLDP